jgi:aminopeptidase N
MDAIITDAVQPTWRLREARVAQTAGAMGTDELLSTQAIRLPVTTREGIAASFDGAITYVKGAGVLRMFEAQAGEARWQGFIRSYLTAHRWGNATADDFLGTMRATLGSPLAEGFASFLEQPGVPRVEGALECSGGRPTLVLSQRRSLPVGVAAPDPSAAWGVPVCVRYGDGATRHRACVQLERSATARTRLPLETAACPTWTLLNADGLGYYRSAVDARQARALLTPTSAAARQARPTSAERLMLVADVRGAAARGELDPETTLGLAPLVAADADDRVAALALALAQLRADELPEPLYQRARRFRVRTFGPLAHRLGWRRQRDDSDDRQALRKDLVGTVALAGDAALEAEGTALAKTWLADPARAGLADDLVEVALGVAASRGDEALFERYLQAARKAADRTARDRLLFALGHFRDPRTVARALAVMVETEFDSRETMWIILPLLRQRETRAQAWAWFQSHVDALLASRRSDEASWLLEAITSGFCDQAHRDEAAALFGARAERIDGARKAVDRGLEQADRCIARLARERPALERFLGTVR